MNINEEVIECKNKEENLCKCTMEDINRDVVSQPGTSDRSSHLAETHTPDETSSQCEKDDLLDDITLTHEELIKVTNSTLKELLKSDPVMNDLPSDVTVDEVEALIAVLHGQAITVFIKRGDNDDIPVIVKQKDSRVSDLKRAFKRALTLKLRREGERYKISWKHVWRVNWLCCDGNKLDNDNGLLKDYGVVNKSKVTFVPKVKEKPRKSRKPY